MFWNTLNDDVRKIDTLLDDPNTKFEDVLRDESLIIECKLENHKLIEYLTSKDGIMNLVLLATHEPPPYPKNEKERYFLANMAFEVLVCDLPAITMALMNHEIAVAELFYFFVRVKDEDEELNSLLASFVCKIVYKLWKWGVDYASQNILLKFPYFVDVAVRHIGTSSVMDLLFYTLTAMTPANMDEFYHQHNLIPKLISKFEKGANPRARANASNFLCDTIRHYRENSDWNKKKCNENLIIQEIESTSTVSKLLDNMFEDRTEKCLVNGIEVLQSLLEYKKYRANQPQRLPIEPQADEIRTNDAFDGVPRILPPSQLCIGDLTTSTSINVSSVDIEKLTKSVLQVHAAIEPRLSDFHSLLINPPHQNPVRTVVGLIEKPFGATRIEVVHLIRALLSGNNPQINRKIEEIKTLVVLLDFFFEYSYNNFLHTQVEQSIKCILDNSKSNSPVTSPISESGNDSETDQESVSALIKQLFVECNLFKRIVDSCTPYLPSSTSNLSHSRPGYIGHLVMIANHIISCKDDDIVKRNMEIVDANVRKSWEEFVCGPLEKENQIINNPLVKDVTDTDTTSEEKAFLEYQVQQMTRQLQIQLEWNVTNDEIVHEEEKEKVEDGDTNMDPLIALQLNSKIPKNESADDEPEQTGHQHSQTGPLEVSQPFIGSTRCIQLQTMNLNSQTEELISSLDTPSNSQDEMELTSEESKFEASNEVQSKGDNTGS